MAQLAKLGPLTEDQHSAIKEDSNLQSKLINLWIKPFDASAGEGRPTPDCETVSRWSIVGARAGSSEWVDTDCWNSGGDPPVEWRLNADGDLQKCFPRTIGIGVDPDTGGLQVRIRKEWIPVIVFIRITGPRPVHGSTHVAFKGLPALRYMQRRSNYCSVYYHESQETYEEWIKKGINVTSIDHSCNSNHWPIVVERAPVVESKHLVEKVGKRLTKSGITSKYPGLIDRMTDDMRALVTAYLERDSSRTLEIHTGDELVGAYEEGVGEHSCMAGERSWITEFYGVNDDRVSLAVLSAPYDNPNEMIRCLLWELPNGRIVYDRIYSEASPHGCMVTALKERFGDRLLPAWDEPASTRLAADTYVLKDMVIPNNDAIPYLDSALIRLRPPGDPQRHEYCDILPVFRMLAHLGGAEAWKGQSDYEGGPLLNGEGCPGCGETIEPDECLSETEDGDRCQSCLDCCYVYSERMDLYLHSDNAVCDYNDEYIRSRSAVHIESADVWVHTADLNAYLEDQLSAVDTATTARCVDFINYVADFKAQ